MKIIIVGWGLWKSDCYDKCWVILWKDFIFKMFLVLEKNCEFKKFGGKIVFCYFLIYVSFF